MAEVAGPLVVALDAGEEESTGNGIAHHQTDDSDVAEQKGEECPRPVAQFLAQALHPSSTSPATRRVMMVVVSRCHCWVFHLYSYFSYFSLRLLFFHSSHAPLLIFHQNLKILKNYLKKKMKNIKIVSFTPHIIFTRLFLQFPAPPTPLHPTAQFSRH